MAQIPVISLLLSHGVVGEQVADKAAGTLLRTLRQAMSCRDALIMWNGLIWELQWLPVAERIQYKHVLAGSQVTSGKHAGIYLRPSDIGCQYSRSIYTARFIVWQPRRAVDTRWIGDRVFSVAARGAWNRLPTELKLLRSMDSFPRDLKTFMFHSVYGTQYKCLSYSYSTTVVDTRSVTDCGHPTYSRAHVYASSVRQILAKRFHFDRRTSKQIWWGLQVFDLRQRAMCMQYWLILK